MNSPGGLKSSVGKNGFVAKWLRRSMPRSLRHHWRGVLQHTSFADSIRKKRRSDLMRRSASMARNSNWCLAKGEREQRRLVARTAASASHGTAKGGRLGAPLSSEPKRMLSPFLIGIGRDSPSVTYHFT